MNRPFFQISETRKKEEDEDEPWLTKTRRSTIEAMPFTIVGESPSPPQTKTLLPSSNRFFQIEDPLFDIVSQGGITTNTTTNTTTSEHHQEVLSTANVLGLSPRETDVLLFVNVISKNQAANVTEIVEEENRVVHVVHTEVSSPFLHIGNAAPNKSRGNNVPIARVKSVSTRNLC